MAVGGVSADSFVKLLDTVLGRQVQGLLALQLGLEGTRPGNHYAVTPLKVGEAQLKLGIDLFQLRDLLLEQFAVGAGNGVAAVSHATLLDGIC